MSLLCEALSWRSRLDGSMDGICLDTGWVGRWVVVSGICLRSEAVSSRLSALCRAYFTSALVFVACGRNTSLPLDSR